MTTRNLALRESNRSLPLSDFNSGRQGRNVGTAAAVWCALMLFAFISLPALAQSVSFAGLQSTVPASGLNQPAAVAVDTAGDVFIADTVNNRVVELPAGCTSSACQTTLVSGLNAPQGVAVDRSGDVFIGDTHNNRVVEVPAGCTSSACQVLVGSGFNGPAGVAVDMAGDLFVADYYNNRVVEVPAGCTSSSCQISLGSGLNGPAGVAVDGSGDVFIADYYNNRVVEVPAGCTSSSCQVSLGSGLNLVAGVALDPAGNLYIADAGNNRVVEVPAGCTSGSCQNAVGSGLSGPLGLAVTVDAVGDVFIADTYNNRVVEVQKVAVNFGAVKVGASTTLTLTYNINSSLTLGSSVRELTQGTSNLDFNTSSAATCVGSQTAGNTCTVTVSFAPRAPGLRVGAVQIADSTGNVVATTFIRGQGLAPALAFVTGTQITIGSGLLGPAFVADAAGNLYIADAYHNQIVEIPAGCTTSSCQITLGGGFNTPFAVAVDGAGDVLVTDSYNNQIVELPAGCTSASCQFTLTSAGLNKPEGLAVDGAGNIFVADTHNNRVLEIPYGCSTTACQIPLGFGLNLPSGLAVDASDNLYISDFNNNRVVEVPVGCASSACQVTVASGLNGAASVALDGANDLFIADYYNNRVLEIPAGCTSSTCQTTLGSGLKYPAGVTVDGAGNAFIADFGNSRVLELPGSQAPSLSFATTLLNSSSPQTVSLQNVGNAALTFASIAASANFAVNAGTTTCSTSSPLAPGASCNVGVTCSPTIGGSLNGSLTLSDNALNGAPAIQAIPLSCTAAGSAPAITSANSVTFGANTPSTFTVTTTGSPTPSLAETGALPAGVTFVDNGNGTGTLAGTPTTGGTFAITFTATNVLSQATQSFTLKVSSGTAATLGNYYNVYGIASAGTNPRWGGFDNDGYAYNSSLLGSSLTYQGVTFPLAAANTLDAISSQTVPLPAGSYTQLLLLGAAVNGPQTNQTIVVTYTDGSTSAFSQSFSDWFTGPKGYSGESTVIQTANRITPNGGTQSGTIDVYGYMFPLTAGKTAASVRLPWNRNVVFLGIGMGGAIGTASPITPYIQVNGGSWQQTATATVIWGSSVNLGPQPLNVGSWSWTGPNGYTSTARQINNIPLSSGTNTFVATYTNPSGIKSTQTFTINVTGTPITPYIQVNGQNWQQTNTVTVWWGSWVNLGPQPITGGSWKWTGPNGFTSTSRQINLVAWVPGTSTFTATYTNSSGAQSMETFTINVY